MSTIKDYIMVVNAIPKEVCETLIDECNNGIWQKHKWNNYASGTFESEPTKELDVMPCTKEQQAKITPYLVKALGEYQEKNSTPGEKTQGPWLTKFSPIRFNRYQVGTMMREHYDHIHSIFDGQMKGVPLVSIVANLNEDYEGSEFYCRGEKIELKRHPLLLCKLGLLIYNEVICYKR